MMAVPAMEDIIREMELEAAPALSPLEGQITEGSTSEAAAHREQLAILVASGKPKEFVGVNLTHDDVKKLPEKDVEKYYKRYVAARNSRMNDAIIDSFLKLTSKAVGWALPIDDIEKLHHDLKTDYIINQELASAAGMLSFQCGPLMAVASAALHTANHIVLPAKEDLIAEDDFSRPPTITIDQLREGGSN